jgi:hypothetical protein
MYSPAPLPTPYYSANLRYGRLIKLSFGAIAKDEQFALVHASIVH